MGSGCPHGLALIAGGQLGDYPISPAGELSGSPAGWGQAETHAERRGSLEPHYVGRCAQVSVPLKPSIVDRQAGMGYTVSTLCKPCAFFETGDIMGIV